MAAAAARDREVSLVAVAVIPLAPWPASLGEAVLLPSMAGAAPCGALGLTPTAGLCAMIAR